MGLIELYSVLFHLEQKIKETTSDYERHYLVKQYELTRLRIADLRRQARETKGR